MIMSYLTYDQVYQEHGKGEPTRWKAWQSEVCD